MKKTFITLTLGAALAVASMGSVFAADTNTVHSASSFERGNGFGQLYTSNLSVEELLKEKMARIDQMVVDGKITKEEGENYKQIISERMSNCTTPGENRDKNERLGIGFGRGNGRSSGRGMGFGRTAR
ncbi:hypothetical protein QBE52_17465 [Clostridiaceae bacterium 35-E11]